MQYAACLDPDFIIMKIFKELLPQNEKLLLNAINKLESLSLISVIIDKNGQIGFRNTQKATTSDTEFSKILL